MTWAAIGPWASRALRAAAFAASALGLSADLAGRLGGRGDVFWSVMAAGTFASGALGWARRGP